MNDNAPQGMDDDVAPASREEMQAALFANMVIQHTQMALMFLGKVPHPETGEVIQDLESARMLIDQLEMLEAKTKGNLSPQEQGLLKQGLTSLRMAFVDSVEPSSRGRAAFQPQPEARSAAPSPAPAPAAAPKPEAAAPANPPLDESRKKFSKKY